MASPSQTATVRFLLLEKHSAIDPAVSDGGARSPPGSPGTSTTWRRPPKGIWPCLPGPGSHGGVASAVGGARPRHPTMARGGGDPDLCSSSGGGEPSTLNDGRSCASACYVALVWCARRRVTPSCVRLRRWRTGGDPALGLKASPSGKRPIVLAGLGMVSCDQSRWQGGSLARSDDDGARGVTRTPDQIGRHTLQLRLTCLIEELSNGAVLKQPAVCRMA